MTDVSGIKLLGIFRALRAVAGKKQKAKLWIIYSFQAYAILDSIIPIWSGLSKALY